MSDNDKKTKSFWTTVPGILTGCAAVITAVGSLAGLLTVLISAGVISSPLGTPTPSLPPTVAEATDPAAATVIPPTETHTSVPPSDTATPPPISRVIPFASPNDSSILNPVFGWQQGSSADNSYSLTGDPYALTLISDGNTDQWDEDDSAPLILFPIEGDFEAQVRVKFSERSGGEFAGLGVRSIQDHYTWLRIVTVFSPNRGHIIALDVDSQGKSGKENAPTYYSDTVYMKMQRRGQVFDFNYSADESHWVTLRRNYSFEMPSNVEIFLVASSWRDEGTQAQFHNFTLTSSRD